MESRQVRRLPWFSSLLLLTFETAHLASEHLHGGVRSHHMLDRPDLPVISNWLGLLVLPVLGWLLGRRIRDRATALGRGASPVLIGTCFVGALLYGAALAASFVMGASTVTSSLFFGFFVLAAALPIYRIEFIAGLVVGMTFTFGGVLPCAVALVFATLSAALRFGFKEVLAAVRRVSRPRG